MRSEQVYEAKLNFWFSKTISPWLVWGLGCLFYFYECLLRVSPGVMSTELMQDFQVTSQTLGLLSGVYFYSYAIMQLPGGILIDYLGPRKILIFATFICALSTVGFGLTENFYMACLTRLMIGFGSAFAAIGTMKLASSWFSLKQFAFLTGLMVTIGMLGAVGGEAPFALLIEMFNWRQTMIAMGLIGILLGLLMLIFMKDSPNKNISLNLPAEETFGSNFFSILKNKQLWLISIYGGLMYLSTPVFCSLWGVPFLVCKFNITKPIAANYISLVFFGWAIASPLWGIFSNYIKLRKPPLYIGSIGSFIVAILFIYAPLSPGFFLQILLFSFGFFSAGFLPAFAIVREICSRRYAATSLSFMNMMNMIGIALIQPLIGLILDWQWQGEFYKNLRFYPLEAYYIALVLLPIGILVSITLLYYIKETNCRPINP